MDDILEDRYERVRKALRTAGNGGAGDPVAVPAQLPRYRSTASTRRL